MKDNTQPEALRLADDLDSTIPQCETWHVSSELRRLHTENALLKAGYDAARLEINHLRGVTKVVAHAQPVAWLVHLPSEDAQRIYDSQDDIGYVDDLTNNADAKVIPLYTAQPSAAAAAKAPAAPTCPLTQR